MAEKRVDIKVGATVDSSGFVKSKEEMRAMADEAKRAEAAMRIVSRADDDAFSARQSALRVSGRGGVADKERQDREHVQRIAKIEAEAAAATSAAGEDMAAKFRIRQATAARLSAAEAVRAAGEKDKQGLLASLKGALGEESTFGLIAKSVAGAGALAGLGFVFTSLKGSVDQAAKLRAELADGTVSAGELGERVAGSIPVLGHAWQLGRSIRELFTQEIALREKRQRQEEYLVVTYGRQKAAIEQVRVAVRDSEAATRTMAAERVAAGLPDAVGAAGLARKLGAEGLAKFDREAAELRNAVLVQGNDNVLAREADLRQKRAALAAELAKGPQQSVSGGTGGRGVTVGRDPEQVRAAQAAVEQAEQALQNARVVRDKKTGELDRAKAAERVELEQAAARKILDADANLRDMRVNNAEAYAEKVRGLAAEIREESLRNGGFAFEADVAAVRRAAEQEADAVAKAIEAASAATGDFTEGAERAALARRQVEERTSARIAELREKEQQRQGRLVLGLAAPGAAGLLDVVLAGTDSLRGKLGSFQGSAFAGSRAEEAGRGTGVGRRTTEAFQVQTADANLSMLNKILAELKALSDIAGDLKAARKALQNIGVATPF